MARIVRDHYYCLRRCAASCIWEYRLQRDLEPDDLLNTAIEVVLRNTMRLVELNEQQVVVYLERVTRRKAIDACRAKYRKIRDARRQDPLSTDMLSSCLARDAEPTGLELDDSLGKAYESLTADERMISMLRRSGRDWQEIATVFQRTEGAVRMQLQRAVGRVQQQLFDQR